MDEETKENKRSMMKGSMAWIHATLGHVHEGLCQATAKYYNGKVSGTVNNCEACMKAKARQKPLSMAVLFSEKAVGESIYIDILPMKETSLGGSKNWLLAVDKKSGYC